MSVLGIGISYGVSDPVCDVFRHAHCVCFGRGRGRLHGDLHARGLARYRDAERLRGDGLDHAAVDPAVHPQGGGDRQIPRRPGSLLGAACLAAPRAGRAGRRQRVRLRAVCGDGGLLARDLFGDRLGRHSRDAQARLFGRLCRRHHRRRRHARHSAAALDHHDPVRGRRGEIAGPAVPRRHRPRTVAGNLVRHLRRAALPQGICGGAGALREEPERSPRSCSATNSRWPSASPCCRGCFRSCCCSPAS